MNTSPVVDDTVGALLAARAGRGGHPLLICDDQTLSYGDADRRSAELAAGLLALGAGKGTHVGVLYPNGPEFVVAMLAAARIGAVVVPFSTFATTAELRTQLLDSDVSIMLSARSFRTHDYRARLSDTTGIPCLRHLLFDPPGAPVGAAQLDPVQADVDGSDVLAIIYTSGSTGPPKGAVHTHAGLLGHQRNLNRIRGLGAPDVLFCNSPFFWIGGFAFGLLATLVAGSTLVCSNATDAGATLDLLETVRPNITNGFTAGIAHLPRHPGFGDRDLSSLRCGNLYPIMAPEARPADPELRHSMLGMTEAGSVLLIDGDETDQPEHRRGSFGRPAPGFETKVLDTGELCIRGPYVMQGYHGRSREDCFDADGWFHTGDLVRVDEDGYFYYLARAGSMIKTAGANVTPAEVVKAIAARGFTAHVAGLPDAERGQVVAAVIVSDEPVDTDALRRALRADLSAYKVPRRFAVCRPDEIPVLSSGKVDLPSLTGLFDD